MDHIKRYGKWNWLVSWIGLIKVFHQFLFPSCSSCIVIISLCEHSICPFKFRIFLLSYSNFPSHSLSLFAFIYETFSTMRKKTRTKIRFSFYIIFHKYHSNNAQEKPKSSCVSICDVFHFFWLSPYFFSSIIISFSWIVCKFQYYWCCCFFFILFISLFFAIVHRRTKLCALFLSWNISFSYCVCVCRSWQCKKLVFLSCTHFEWTEMKYLKGNKTEIEFIMSRTATQKKKIPENNM